MIAGGKHAYQAKNRGKGGILRMNRERNQRILTTPDGTSFSL